MHRTGIEIVRRLVLVLTLAAPAMALPFGAPGAETVIGVFALPDSAQEGSGEMTVTELAPLAAELEVTFADARTGQRITEFAEELTQQLHLLAIDETLTRLIHEHVKTAGEEGVFTARMQFPSPGLYHIYADAVPAGMGQQVLRFDVTIDGGGQPGEMPDALETSAPIIVPAGPYTVAIDASGLRADRAGRLGVSIARDGAPASDLEPYLGVAAHAVLINAQDLSYVHAHPTTAGDEHASHSAHDAGGHDEVGTEHDTPSSAEPDRHAHGHSDAAPAAMGIAPEMVLNVTPRGPGRHALFLEFMGEGCVHTISLPLAIPS